MKGLIYLKERQKRKQHDNAEQYTGVPLLSQYRRNRGARPSKVSEYKALVAQYVC